MQKKQLGVFFAILAAALYALNAPFSKLLLSEIPPRMMAALLLFGEAISRRLWAAIGFVTLACALLISLFIGERFCALLPSLGALLLGFVAYGLSIFFYIRAQSILGAAKTSTYYAISPFIGSFFSLILYKTIPSALFLLALGAMSLGAYLSTTDGN